MPYLDLNGLSYFKEKLIDQTLSVAGKAADAQAFGEALDNQYPSDTASGAIASFTDGADNVPVSALSVSIEPIQNLNGQTSPYPAGGGTNKFVIGDAVGLAVKSACYNLDIDIDAVNETIRIHGTPSWTESGSYSFRAIATETGYWGTTPVNHDYTGYNAFTEVVSKSSNITSAPYFAVSSSATIGINSFTVSDTNAVDITLRLSLNPTSTPTAWSPYENICPITGHTAVEVYREATYDTTAQPQITIPLGQTVYGGTLDVLNGVLTVNRAGYAFNGTEGDWFKSSSYRGSFYRAWANIPSGGGVNQGTFACSHAGFVSNFSEYAYGKCASDGALNIWVMQDPDATINDLKAYLAEQYASGTPVTICYTLSTPITIDLTDIPELTTLYGTNNIWSDSGDVSVTYRADIGLYLQKVIAAALGS